MRVLVGCEESQVVTKVFRARGHEAFSCDLQPTRGDFASWHFQHDIVELLQCEYFKPWDLIILHPDCTALALSGNRWYGKGQVHNSKRIQSIEWTTALWNLAVSKCPRVALENPKSVIFPVLRKLGADVQYVQPWMFGHGEVKETGFALRGLPRLEPTNIVDGREERVWKMAPSPTRKRDRSVTYSGIAKAMAEQWGKV